CAQRVRHSLPTRRSSDLREQELRRAMRLARLTVLRLLGYRDSGMAGTEENEHPRALINIPGVEAVAHVAGQIRELRPRVVITFRSEEHTSELQSRENLVC